MDMTETLSTLVRLTSEQRVAEAQAVLDTLIREDPEVAAQWYVVARLLLHPGRERWSTIQSGLAATPRRRLQQSIHALETVQRLEQFLAQVRGVRPGTETPDREGVRAGLMQFLRRVRACQPEESPPVDQGWRLDRSGPLLVNATDH